jgi:thioredoxin 1
MSNFSEIINQDKPVLVDFFADWCGPCKMMSPILKEVKDAFGDKISIIKIDVDKNQPLAAKYQVRGVPTLILYKSGKQVWKQSGVVQKNELVSIINNLGELL